MDRGDAARVMEKLPIALTVAGSDSGAGAGVQADLRTFAAFGVYAASAITAITAQNTVGVTLVHPMPPAVLSAQIEAVLQDFNVRAIKIGMLADAANVKALVQTLLKDALRRSHDGRPLKAPFVVLDPVLAASTGQTLAETGLVPALRDRLLPRLDCLTPNLAEAAALLGTGQAADEATMITQGEALLELGPRAVLMKGGHLAGEQAVDWLVISSEEKMRFAGPRLASPNTHGTGCTLSSAIAAQIVLGASLEDAIGEAKAFVSDSIARGRDVALGEGAGPLLQFVVHKPSARKPPGS